MTTRKLNRRRFLAAMGLGSAAAAAAVATRKTDEPAKSQGTSVASGKGYQLTEHVRRYYETTKV